MGKGLLIRFVDLRKRLLSRAIANHLAVRVVGHHGADAPAVLAAEASAAEGDRFRFETLTRARKAAQGILTSDAHDRSAPTPFAIDPTARAHPNGGATPSTTPERHDARLPRATPS